MKAVPLRYLKRGVAGFVIGGFVGVIIAGFLGLVIGILIGSCIGLIDGAFWSFRLWDLVLVWAVVWAVLGLFDTWRDKLGLIVIWVVMGTIWEHYRGYYL